MREAMLMEYFYLLRSLRATVQMSSSVGPIFFSLADMNNRLSLSVLDRPKWKNKYAVDWP
jgi:hypothetical protein